MFFILKESSCNLSTASILSSGMQHRGSLPGNIKHTGTAQCKKTQPLVVTQFCHIKTHTFSSGVSKIFSCEPEVPLLEVLAAKPLPTLRTFDHHSANG
jgi:hypothetical protein